MTKLYVYTTVKGFQGSWDEALESGMVEIVATIEGEDQKAIEKKAHELYGDSDTYGWTYSNDGFDYTEEVEEIRLAGDEEDEQAEAQAAGATWMETVRSSSNSRRCKVKMIRSKHFTADEGLEGLRNTMELISRCWGSGVKCTPDIGGLRELMNELDAAAGDPEFCPDVTFKTGDDGEIVLLWRGSWTRGRWLKYVYYPDGTGRLTACTGTGEKSKFFSAQDFLRTNLPEICRIVGPVELEAANTAGATWMETVLTECENPQEWLGLSYSEFLQAAANANSPAFPDFESGEELDAAYDGAWGQLEFGRKLHAADKTYQEDLEKRKEGWKDYDGE